MAYQSTSSLSSNATNGTSALPRIQIPGLHINDEEVDGEILIQWMPSADNHRPQSSTVFIVAGPNAQRPGLQPHNGQSNPHQQGLTMTQTEAFAPPENPAGTITAQVTGGKKVGPKKLYKKPGPQKGYKRKAVTLKIKKANEVEESPPTVSSRGVPRKRSRTAITMDGPGDESTVLATPTQLSTPQAGLIAAEDDLVSILPLIGSEIASAGVGEVKAGGDGFEGELAEASVKASAKAPTKRTAKTPAKRPAKEVTVEDLKPSGGKTVDRLGRKRARDSSGHYIPG